MTIEVRVPQLPESVADATLVAWHKQPGDTVSRDENLVDLETDKVVLEVPAPTAGVLAEIKLKDGTVVTSGQLLALIEESAAIPGASAPAIMASADGASTAAKDAAKPATTAAAAATTAIHQAVATNAALGPAPGADTGVKLSPAAKRVAEENKVDPRALVGSGRDGRVSKSDVVNFLAAKDAPAPVAAPRRSGRRTRAQHARRTHRSACTDDPSARPHRRAHGPGAGDAGAPHLVQRGRPARRQRTALALQGLVRETARRETRFHVLLHQGVRRSAEEIPGGQRVGGRQRHRLSRILRRRRRRLDGSRIDRPGAARRRSAQLCRHREVRSAISPRAPARAPSPWRN